MRHHQPAALGLANQDEPFFTDRVIRIGNRQRLRVGKGSRGLWKPDFMLPQIAGCLLRIPGELKAHSGIYGSPMVVASA
jgi:hypothetical protein